MINTESSSIWPECSAWNREVVGSNPTSQIGPVAQPAEAAALKTVQCRFDSCQGYCGCGVAVAYQPVKLGAWARIPSVTLLN